MSPRPSTWKKGWPSSIATSGEGRPMAAEQRVPIRADPDIVLARQQGRTLAAELDLPSSDPVEPLVHPPCGYPSHGPPWPFSCTRRPLGFEDVAHGVTPS